MQFLLRLNYLVRAKNALVLFLPLLLDPSSIFDDDGGGIDSEHQVFDVVSQFEFLARIRTFHERSLAVAELANLIIAPELEPTVVVFSHAVAAAARNVGDHQCLVGLVEQVRQIGHESQVVQVTRPVDSERAFQVVPAAVDLLKDDSSLLALRYND